jgi:hypothetical protein
MKRNVITLPFVAIASLLLMSGLTGCLKNNNDSSTQPQAAVSILQVSPSDVSMDLYVNDDKINTTAITYPAAAYKTLKSATYTFSLLNATTGDTIARRTDSLQSAYYSLIVYDTASATNMLLFQDQFQSSSSNSGLFLRYLQLSPDAGPVDFYINTTLASAERDFADIVYDPENAIFDGIDAGVYNFTAVSENTGDTLASLSNVTLTSQNGNAYTLMLRGLASHGTDSLGLKLTLQANY